MTFHFPTVLLLPHVRRRGGFEIAHSLNFQELLWIFEFYERLTLEIAMNMPHSQTLDKPHEEAPDTPTLAFFPRLCLQFWIHVNFKRQINSDQFIVFVFKSDLACQVRNSKNVRKIRCFIYCFATKISELRGAAKAQVTLGGRKLSPMWGGLSSHVAPVFFFISRIFRFLTLLPISQSLLPLQLRKVKRYRKPRILYLWKFCWECILVSWV